MSTTLAKAMQYATDKPHGGVILKLLVALGKCRVITPDDPGRRTWSRHGYDSAWAAPGVLSRRSHGENCVHDPGRIDVVDIIAGETRKLQVAGFRTVRTGDRVVLVSEPCAPVPPRFRRNLSHQPDVLGPNKGAGAGADTAGWVWDTPYRMAAAAVAVLDTYCWFLGTMTRNSAADRLGNRATGSFLVRIGTAQRAVISLRYTRPDGRDTLFNVRISRQPVSVAATPAKRTRLHRQSSVGMPPAYRYGVCPSTTFPDIPALIAYYMQHPALFFANLAGGAPYRAEQLLPFIVDTTTVLRERQAAIGGYGSI